MQNGWNYKIKKYKDTEFAKNSLFGNVIPIVVSPNFEMHSQSLREMGKFVNTKHLFKLLGYYLSLLYVDKQAAFQLKASESNNDFIAKSV